MGISNSYTSKNIKVLKGLEAVRLRPAMYIGDTNINGLHHLIWEIFDNSIDEVFAGYCNYIEVKLLKKNFISIQDNGRGIPIDNFENTNKSTLEIILTTLHSGGKFNNNSYKISGGLHGVGSSVVNALSADLKIDVYRNLKIYHQHFQKGNPISRLIEKDNDELIPNGTKVVFTPDIDIFHNIEFNAELITQKIKESAFLHNNLKISFYNENTDELKTFQYKNGIIDFLATLIIDEEKIFTKQIYLHSEKHNISIHVILCYSKLNVGKILSFCNGIKTIEGGVHEDGVRQGMLKSINFYTKKNNLDLKTFQITSNDIVDGLFAIININFFNPQFEGQTKTKLTNKEIKKKVFHFIYENFMIFMNENPIESKILINYLQNCAKSRIASQKAKTKIKETASLGRIILPGKLSDCSSKNIDERELFIVEGDSAGGSAKLARDRFTQAILPLRGKIINVQKENNERVLKNTEIDSLQKAIGISIINDDQLLPNSTSLLKDDELNKDDELKTLRYSKIILMTDADVDGNHIQILLLTFFINKMPLLIKNGNIYIVKPPLFKVKFGKKKEKYLFSDEELLDFRNNQNYTIKSIQRYKGLGEMNPDELWETTMDNSKRKIFRIYINDFADSLSLFEKLMGASGIAARKKFISSQNNPNIQLDF